MANKFKKGDWVVGLPSASKQYSVTKEGWEGEITNVDKDDKYITIKGVHNERIMEFNMLESKYFKLQSKTKQMATKKKSSSVELNDGDYFTANYGKAKIRGVVAYSGAGEYHLLNATHGEINDGCDEDWQYQISVDTDMDDDDHTGALGEAGVTNFQVCKDKRQIAVINGDILPSVLGYKARKDRYGDIEFGCGEVVLSKADITGFVKFREKIAETGVDINELSTALRFIQEDVPNVSDSFDDGEIEGIFTAQTAKNLEKAANIIKAVLSVDKRYRDAFETVVKDSNGNTTINDLLSVDLEIVKKVLAIK